MSARRIQTIFVVTWDKLLDDAERLHREYLEIVKSRAPEDDPRIQELVVDQPSDRPAAGTTGD